MFSSAMTWPGCIRHIDPMAQDFRAAFGLGEDDKHIATVDADGVALAAIQEIYKLSLQKDQEIAQLKRDLEANAQEIEQLRTRLARLEQALSRP